MEINELDDNALSLCAYYAHVVCVCKSMDVQVRVCTNTLEHACFARVCVDVMRGCGFVYVMRGYGCVCACICVYLSILWASGVHSKFAQHTTRNSSLLRPGRTGMLHLTGGDEAVAAMATTRVSPPYRPMVRH